MEIKLNRNGWHRRLQKYVFNDPPMYHNFCPYFWLTNFCIFVTFLIPIVPLVKLVILICGGIGWLFDKAVTYFEECICQPWLEASANKMNQEQIVQSWFFNSWKENAYGEWNSALNQELHWWEQNHQFNWYNTKQKKRDEQVKKFEAWKKNHPNWQELLADYKEKQKVQREKWAADALIEREKVKEAEKLKHQKKYEAERRRQKMFTAIAKHTKWIVYTIAAVAAGFILAGFYKLVIIIWHWSADHYYPERVIPTLKFIGWVILGAGGVVGVVILGVKIVQKTSCSFCVCDTWFGKMMKAIRGVIWKGICKFFDAIGDFFTFIGHGIMVFKKDYCPGIEWEEEKKTN